MPEESFELFHVYLWKYIKPSARHKAAVSDKAMEMRMKVDQISEGLDRDHNTWHGLFFIQSRAEELFNSLIGALAELAQELSIKSEMGSEHLGDSKDILPMREGVEDFFGDPFAKHEDSFLVT